MNDKRKTLVLNRETVKGLGMRSGIRTGPNPSLPNSLNVATTACGTMNCQTTGAKGAASGAGSSSTAAQQ